MRKTKPEAKKGGSGYEHLPVRTQHIIDRLKLLEPYRRVGRPTQSTLARLEESNVQPMEPTQPKRKKAKSSSSELESGSDSASGSDSRSEVKSHLIFSLVKLLTNLIDSFSSPEHFILFFVQSVCYKLKHFFPINALRVKKTLA